MVTALSTAAKSGVDVRIVTPHIPDKWYVHAVTRAYYETLLQNGVRIYEYTPGFIHAKTFVVDDEYGTVGKMCIRDGFTAVWRSRSGRGARAG